MNASISLPNDRMPEAEVALRLAEYLSERPGFHGHVEVAIDGAQVRVSARDVFNVAGYLSLGGWVVDRPAAAGSRNGWATFYRRGGATMEVHSRSGTGDVVAAGGGRRVIAECKKGPLVKRPGSPEYPLLTTALGQALLFNSNPDDVVVAAVPDTRDFRRIAEAWRIRPRLVHSGIQIALVNRTGEVRGLALEQLPVGSAPKP